MILFDPRVQWPKPISKVARGLPPDKEEEYINARIDGFHDWYLPRKHQLLDEEVELIEELLGRLDFARLPALDMLANLVILINDRLK